MSLSTAFTSSLTLGLLLTAVTLADDADKPADTSTDKPTYLLRYKFQPGEILRWKVVHQALVHTTVSGTTQTAETRSESIKVWNVTEIDAEAGKSTFVHSVESVDMRQAVTGRQEVRYNSATDAVVPAEFDAVAKAVGIPLSTITLDNRGLISNRHEERAQPNANPGEMTVPLPEKEVAVGESWSLPHDASVRQKDGSTKTVKTRQEFTLSEVDKGVATIKITTIVLTPIRDAALEAQLIQHVTDGSVRFDIAAGRIVGQQTDIDKRVIGFQGEASSLHYVTRFTEELLPQAAVAKADKATAKTAAAPKTSDEKSTATTGTPAAANGAKKPVATKPAATANKSAAKAPPATTKPKAKTGTKTTTTQKRR